MGVKRLVCGEDQSNSPELYRVLFSILVHTSTVNLSGIEGPLPWLGAASENILELDYLDWLKMHFQAWYKVFLQILF